MGPDQVRFPLAPVYERHGIEFKQAWAREIHPEGDAGHPAAYVVIERVPGGTEKVARCAHGNEPLKRARTAVTASSSWSGNGLA
jgi:hypothetical protein